jgi:hypothetical protein
MRLQALSLLATDMGPCATAKDAQCRVVGLALVRHLVRRCVRWDCRQGRHVEQTTLRVERLAPEASGQACAVEHGDNVFLERAIAAFCNATLLQHAFHCVFALDAVFSKERVPQVANVLAALVVVQASDLDPKLQLNKGLEHLECFKGVALFLEQPDPAVLRPVVDKRDPVPIAGHCGHGDFVQIGVDSLEQACCTMRCFGREQIAVMLAHNAGLAVKQQRRVAVNEQTVGQLATYGALQGVFANVS